MTEAEWLACTDPNPMLEFLLGKGGERKLRLFACACCRRVWHLLADPRSRAVVEALEGFVDGTLAQEVLDRAADDAVFAADELNASAEPLSIVAASSASEWAQHGPETSAHAAACAAAYQRFGEVRPGTRDSTECAIQGDLIRCIFGNSFRPSPSTDPSLLIWNGSLIRTLSQTIYDERILPSGTLDADRLAVLADALEDAGCDNADILSHLRGPEPHVRGCWALDLLLGKE
jgi:hypothetical protein